MQTPDTESSLDLLQHAPCGVAVFDATDHLQWANTALAELVGRPLGELAGLSESQLLMPIGEDTPGVVQFQCGGRSARRIGTQLTDGRRAVYYLDVGEELALRSECQALTEQLAQHNTIDPLSGLLNQQAVERGLEPLVSRSRRYGNPLSVVTLALSRLAELHSAAGEPQADALVVGVSQLLRDQLRWADLVGRLDNGDFILVLPETDGPAAEALCGKIAGQLREFTLEGQRLGIAEANFGIAPWTRGDDAALLLGRVAQALAEAGRQGGYSVIMA